MTLNLLSLSLSLLFNLLFLTLLVTGLSFSVKKKEEIKITLLETPRLEVPSSPTDLPQAPPSIPPSPKVSLPEEKLKKESSTPKEKVIVSKEPLREENLLKERLLALQKKAQKEEKALEEENFLKSRLSSLQKEQGFKGEEASRQGQPLERTQGELKELATSQSQMKLSEEFLLLVKRKLQTHFEVPIYLKNKAHLSALVEIEVNPAGEIIRVSFLRKAEDPAFNKAVEKCLVAVNPLPVNKSALLRIEFRAQGIAKVF